MSPEERQLLAGLFDRTRGMGSTPRDSDAEAFIADAVRTQPYAPYLLAQSVIVQEQALRAANDKLQELQTKVTEYEQRAPAASSGGSFLGGLGSLFGGGAQASQQPPRPQGPWGGGSVPSSAPAWGGGGAPQGGFQGGGYGQGGGMMGGGAPSGGGFLHGALGAAAGVAGGVLLADSIRGLFGGHNNPMGIASGVPGMSGFGGGGGGETVVNNYYGNDDSSLQAQDALQDADQDQDDIQDASDDSGYSSDDGSTDV